MRLPIDPPHLFLHCRDEDQALAEKLAVVFIRVFDALPPYAKKGIRKGWVRCAPEIRVGILSSGDVQWQQATPRGAMRPFFDTGLASRPIVLVASIATLFANSYAIGARTMPEAEAERNAYTIMLLKSWGFPIEEAPTA